MYSDSPGHYEFKDRGCSFSWGTICTWEIHTLKIESEPTDGDAEAELRQLSSTPASSISSKPQATHSFHLRASFSVTCLHLHFYLDIYGVPAKKSRSSGMQSFRNAAHDNEVMISPRSGVSRLTATVLCHIKSGYYIWLFFKSMFAEELKKDGMKNHR